MSKSLSCPCSSRSMSASMSKDGSGDLADIEYAGNRAAPSLIGD